MTKEKLTEDQMQRWCLAEITYTHDVTIKHDHEPLERLQDTARSILSELESERLCRKVRVTVFFEKPYGLIQTPSKRVEPTYTSVYHSIRDTYKPITYF